MSKATRVRRPVRAFTLIELLVVIGIIAILMTLAVPMIGRGLRFANRTRCASNLKQLGLAVSLYMDHNQRNPRNYFPPRLAASLPPFANWRDALTNSLADSGSATELFSCPANQFATSNSSFSAHSALFNPNNVPGLTIAAVRRPTSVIMIGDGRQTSATTPASELFSFTTNNTPAQSETAIPAGNIGFRHDYESKPAALFVFVDGHAEPLKTNEVKRKHVDIGY